MERAKAEVVKHYRKVYVDHELAQETGYSEVFKLVMPPALLAHSYASASTATDVLMKMVCGRYTPVPAGADAETPGCGAETQHHGSLGHTDGGSLSSFLLEANPERAADLERDSRRCRRSRRKVSRPSGNRASGSTHPPNVRASSRAALNTTIAKAKNGQRPALKASAAC